MGHFGPAVCPRFVSSWRQSAGLYGRLPPVTFLSLFQSAGLYGRLPPVTFLSLFQSAGLCGRLPPVTFLSLFQSAGLCGRLPPVTFLSLFQSAGLCGRHPSRFSLSSKALGCVDAFHPSRFSLSSKAVLRGWKLSLTVTPKLIKLKLAYTTVHLNAGVTITTTRRGPRLRMNPQCLAVAANRREYSDCNSRTNNYMLIRYGISFSLRP